MLMIKAKGYGTTSEGVEEFDAIRITDQGDTGIFLDILKNNKLVLKFSLQIDKAGFNQMVELYSKGLR